MVRRVRATKGVGRKKRSHERASFARRDDRHFAPLTGDRDRNASLKRGPTHRPVGQLWALLIVGRKWRPSQGQATQEIGKIYGSEPVSYLVNKGRGQGPLHCRRADRDACGRFPPAAS